MFSFNYESMEQYKKNIFTGVTTIGETVTKMEQFYKEFSQEVELMYLRQMGQDMISELQMLALAGQQSDAAPDAVYTIAYIKVALRSATVDNVSEIVMCISDAFLLATSVNNPKEYNVIQSANTLAAGAFKAGLNMSEIKTGKYSKELEDALAELNAGLSTRLDEAEVTLRQELKDKLESGAITQEQYDEFYEAAEQLISQTRAQMGGRTDELEQRYGSSKPKRQIDSLDDISEDDNWQTFI